MAKRWHTNSLTSKPWKQLKGLKLNRLQHKYLGIIIDLNLKFTLKSLCSSWNLNEVSFFGINLVHLSRRGNTWFLQRFFPSISWITVTYSFWMHLISVYQCALCFITECGNYMTVSLYAHRLFTNCFLNHPFLLGLAFSYLCTCAYKYITGAANTLKVRTPVGKRAFNYPSPFKWNNLKKDPKLLGLVTMGRL